MKKLLAILLALVFVFSFAACSDKEETTNAKTTTVADEKADASTDKKENADTPLEAVLALYADAKADSSVLAKDEYAYLTAGSGFASGIDYAYADINGDGTDELLVGMNNGSEENGVDGRVLFNIWKDNNGVAEPLLAETAFGYKAYMVPCENGTVKVGSFLGAYETYYNFYDVTDLSAEPELIDAVCSIYNYATSTQSYYSFDDAIDAFNEDIAHIEITEDEFEAICSEYTTLSGLEWTTL